MSSPSALAAKNNTSIRPQIEAALVRASKATGVDFKYLVDTAVRESNLKTDAKAKTSSATGLFQFIDQTWLATLKEFGPKFGLKQYSDAIEATPSGRYKIPNAALSKEILALRKDPDIAAMMAGAYANKSATYLKELLGREPRQGELYIAHFLGLKGGGQFISAASKKPGVSAAALFPQAAKSNTSIFYDKRGQPRTVRQVYYGLVAKHSSEVASYRVDRPQLVRVPGQPLKLNEGLLKNLGRPSPVENALVATTQYAKSNDQNRIEAVQPENPVQAQQVRYPTAGPGSMGFSNTRTATTVSGNGSLVSRNTRPFAAFSKVADVLKAHVEQQSRVQISTRPTVLDDVRPKPDGKVDGLVATRNQSTKTLRPGQIFVDAAGSFFTMRGKKN